MSSPPVHLAVLVVASDPAKADLATAMVIRGRATSAGHQILQQHVTKVMEAGIRSQLARWIDDPEIDVILVTGAVERPELAAAIKPLVTQKLEGFTDLFRYLAFQELGAGAMLSNAEAAQCNTTFLFVLPGSVVAVGTAMDKLIIPQLDPTTQPRNLVSEMPGPKKRGEAVPSEVAPEKTRGGSGVSPKVPAGGRGKAATGKNIVRRAQDDPPTKQIDVARLERERALSAERPHDAQTKPNIDLRKMLPRVPPGADETLDTDTDVELRAAPPPGHGVEKRLDTSPVIPPPRPVPSSIRSITGNAFSSKERTEPGAPPPRAGTGAKPLPSLDGIEGNAFPEKEGTAPGRSRPLTGPRPRPISVPPTNAFGGKEGTSPGAVSPARMRRPSGPVPAQRTREPSGATRSPGGTREPSSAVRSDAESGRTRAPSSPPPVPPAREWSRSYAATPAVPMPVTRLPSPPSRTDPDRPISSAMISPPSSSIFAAAAKEAAGDEARTTRATRSDEAATTRKAGDKLASASTADEASTTRKPALAAAATAPAAGDAAAKNITPSVEMAPLVDTPPPPRAATAPSGAKAKPASFDDVVSMPTRTSGELPIGTFAYPTQRRRSARALKILALLLAAGAGFAAVVFLLPRLTKHEPESATQSAQNDKPPPVAGKSTDRTPVGATSAGSDHATDPAPTGSDETTGTSPTGTSPTGTSPTGTSPTPATSTSTSKPTTSKPATTSTKPSTSTAKPTTTGVVTKPDTAATTPGTGPVTKPGTTETKPDTTETKPTETKPSGDPACDEVACVLAKYDRPCCARYKPATSDLKPRAGNIPEELDRAAVHEGVEKIKPAVVACGEKAGVKGTVKLAVSVAPDGSVKSADVAESPDDALGTCVAGAMRKAQFGKTVNGGSFTYPFVF